MVCADRIYVSTDIESDGPIPGPHSMLSLGSAAYSVDGKLLDKFAANFQLLPGATGDPKWLAWWNEFPELLYRTRVSVEEPKEAMERYASWVEALPGIPIFVGFPITYDLVFVHWYLLNFVGRNPFEEYASDIRGYAATLMLNSRGGRVGNGPPRPRAADLPDTHIAIDDAIEQGKIICNSMGPHGLAPSTRPVRPRR